jgi:deoxyuridine 5'-triphosphate nucleotidohydrolase
MNKNINLFRPRSTVIRESKCKEIMNVYRHHPDARLPYKSSANAAGYDLFALKDGAVWATPHKVATGISISIPKGTYARIAPRSSLAVKHGVDVLAGVCDFDYASPSIFLRETLLI